MSHYEARLERDLAAIRKHVATLGAAIHAAIRASVAALLNHDRRTANDTILGDLRINQMSRELDGMCHRFVARHLPSAGNLRYVSSVLRLSIALERIGDYAGTISRTACHLSERPPVPVAKDIDMMADQAGRVLQAAMKAFNEVNADLARGTLAMAGQFAPTFDKVFADLIREGEERTRPVPDLFHLMATFNRLERVIHQAKNICEETIFAATGETKKQKTFAILFVDEKNDGASQLAEHYARKVLATNRYQSAGTNAAKQLDPAYVDFADRHGISFQHAAPTPIQPMAHQLDEFGIIIDLTGKAEAQLPPIPFHTILLTWAVDPSRGPEAVYRQIVEEMSLLLDKLSGDGSH